MVIIDGDTPLHIAAEFGKLNIIEALLEAGADVTVTVTAGYYKGKTPLQLTSNKAIRSELRKAGART